ncbi:hypothetical protein ACIBHX_28670 [Nonomuraea sp. NPDC050536]|uniref:hypothetical protein n=1 Tax=Nonomuraea sp. NPDC050536 TaxID=3364366 RepID=UPI0037CC1955
MRGRVANDELAGHPVDAGRGPAPLILLNDGSSFTLPYHRWGNRGPATMRVWLPTPQEENLA